MSQPPVQPKIYHIIHVDRLASIVADGCLWSDAVMANRPGTGTIIGLGDIKLRRLNELYLASHTNLRVGECVPFYFCPRSIMLYLLWQANHPNLTYRGGQQPIVHLQADLNATLQWANGEPLRWAFTLSNAGAYYFDDRSDLEHLQDLDWEAISATKWSGPGISPSIKHGKQAEFLVERSFPWHLVEKIGVYSEEIAIRVSIAMEGANHRPAVEIRRDWYY